MWDESGEKESEIDRQSTNIVGTAGGMTRLFGQMMMLPLVTFVYALESFARALREIQHTGVRTLDAFMGREDYFDHAVAPRYTDLSHSRGEPANRVNGTDCATLDVVGQRIQTTVQPTETEECEMTELNLRGDDLKVVRYTISFVRRDVEEVLDFGVAMINYSTTEGDYTATRREEFIRKVLRPGVGFLRPSQWVTENYPDAQYIDNRGFVIDLPNDDRDKYLRVHLELVTRYEKEERPYKKVKIVP